MSTLTIKTTKGMMWSLGENLGLQAVQFVISIILARILLPEQFGLIGMLTLFLAVAQTLTIGGLTAAFIQKKEANHIDACSMFYFNLVLGMFLTIVLYSIAPLIANFFAEPQLISITRTLSLTIMINALGFVPISLLSKRMDFKPIAWSNIIAAILSGVLGIIMAVNGYGVWSIVGQSILNSFLRTLLTWLASHWQPSLLFSIKSLESMLPFGSRMLTWGLIDQTFQNLYPPIIGRFFSAADVGYYTRAQTMQTAILQPTGTALWRVMFPAFSEIQDDRNRMKIEANHAIINTALFHFPIAIGLLVIAEPLITLLMTERWSNSIPYLQLLCIAGLLYPFEVINSNIMLAIGKIKVVFRLELVKKAIIVLAIFITFRWGIIALLIGQIVTSTIAYLLTSHYSSKFIGYSIFHQLRDVTPSMIMATVMGVGMYLIGVIIEPLFLRLVFQIVIGGSAYLALNVIFNRPTLIQFLQVAKQAILQK